MEKGTKIFFLLAAAVIIVFVSLILWISFSDVPVEPAEMCTLSGGTVSTGMCCLATGDFPNSCLIGACGCSPVNSHQVQTCHCPVGKCFDGEKCA